MSSLSLFSFNSFCSHYMFVLPLHSVALYLSNKKTKNRKKFIPYSLSNIVRIATTSQIHDSVHSFFPQLSHLLLLLVCVRFFLFLCFFVLYFFTTLCLIRFSMQLVFIICSFVRSLVYGCFPINIE